MEITKLDINGTHSKPQVNSTGWGNRNQPTFQTDNSAAKKLEERQIKETIRIENPLPYRAVLAVDENKNIVIKIMDSDGKVVRQVPPEEYIKMADTWRENLKTILHMEV